MLKINEEPKTGELPADRTSVNLLPAESVFQALILQFKLKDPPLLVNPIDPLIQQLTETDVRSIDAFSGKYDFKRVIERLDKMKTLLFESELAEGESPLKALREIMEKGNYRAAIQSARMIDFTRLTSADRREAFIA